MRSVLLRRGEGLGGGVRFAVIALICLLALPLAAQEATPEPTEPVEVTAEATLEATPEATPEATAEATPDVGAESTAEATEQPNPFVNLLPGRYSVEIAYDGYRRTFLVEIPAAYYVSNTLAPLIFVLHGAGGTGAGIAGYSGFDAVAERVGALVVYPDGLGNAWNDGRPGSATLASIDDVGFLTTLIDLLARNLRVDTSRVYATGHSMGGMLSYRLGCLASDRFAAVAPVSSTMPIYIEGECDAAPPVPLMVIQGTDDVIIPWMGIRQTYESAGATVDYWVAHNGCGTAGGQQVLPDDAPDDRTRIVREDYTDCARNADFSFVGVYGGGHTWPGDLIPAIGLGATSFDASAADLIWDFFSQHRLE